MKFVCNSKELEKQLVHVEGGVSNKSTITELLNILIKAEKDSLTLISTDLEIGMETKFPVEIETGGEITIHAKKFLDIVRCFPNCDIIFSADENNKISISALDKKIKTSFKIQGVPKEDFPEIPKFPEKSSFDIPQDILKRMIKKTIFSISTDDSRYFLKGIFFEKNENILKLASTDGKRLALISNELGTKKKNTIGSIVPPKVLNELSKLLGNEGVVNVAFTNNQVFFRLDNILIVSNLLEGNFPDYTQVIPKSFENAYKIDTHAVLDAVSRVSKLADKRSYQIIFSITKDNLTVKAMNPDFGGEAKDEVIIKYDGEEMEIAFNYNYLLDALKEIEEVEVGFNMNTSESPVMVKGVDNEEYFFIVMPMKLNVGE